MNYVVNLASIIMIAAASSIAACFPDLPIAIGSASSELSKVSIDVNC